MSRLVDVSGAVHKSGCLPSRRYAQHGRLVTIDTRGRRATQPVVTGTQPPPGSLQPVAEQGGDTAEVGELPTGVELPGEHRHVAAFLFGGLDDVVGVHGPVTLAGTLGPQAVVEHEQVFDRAVLGGPCDLLGSVRDFRAVGDAFHQLVHEFGLLGDAGLALYLLDSTAFQHLVDPAVTDTARVDGGDLLGDTVCLRLEVRQGVGLREPRPGEHDGVDIEPREHVPELREQLLAGAGVLAFPRRAADGGTLLGAVLGNTVDVGLSLLDGGDSDVWVLGGLDGRRQPVVLVRLEPLLDFEFRVALDVDRVVLAELVLARAALDGTADAQAVREAGELDSLDTELHPEVLALPAGVPELVVVALDAPGRVTCHPVTRLDDMREVPQVVEALWNDCQALPVTLGLRPVGNTHTPVSGVADKWMPVGSGPETRRRIETRTGGTTTRAMWSGTGSRRALTRRRLLCAGGAALVGALAGCTRASEWLVDRFTGDVNLFNTVDAVLTCSLELVDPDGTTLLDEELDLVPDSSTEEGEPTAIYENTLTTAGTYQFSLDIEGDEPARQARVDEQLDIVDPGAEQVVVFLGERFTDEFVTVRVVEDFAELEGDIETA